MQTITPLTIQLACGDLEISVERSLLPIEDLCGYANRRNKKRGFLFVSKVLGKHYPVRPSKIREIHRSLSVQLNDLPGPVLVIGLAETAVALGQGVYESLCPLTTDSLFVHTTRYSSDRPLALVFEEGHSHATSHKLYMPDGKPERDIFNNAKSLVVVDDELSTGNTLCNLMSAYCKLNPSVQELRAVSITDWLGAPRRIQLVKQFAPKNLEFISVLQGSFDFHPNEGFDVGCTVNVIGNGKCKDRYIVGNFGRYGQAGELEICFKSWPERYQLNKNHSILVLGSGEFMYPPLLFAEWLEDNGYNVRYQSTTRSPILIGKDIKCSIETVDNYWDDIPNFLYNVQPGQYDRVLIGYETVPLPDSHNLPAILNATVMEYC